MAPEIEAVCGGRVCGYMAKPYTVTIQYMVLFSHRIVQLPGGREKRERGREGGREREG